METSESKPTLQTPIQHEKDESLQPKSVNLAMFEQLVQLAEETIENPDEGFFGPHSVLWKIMKFNYPWLAGANRMLVLQSIHIWLTQAGTDFSYGFKFPMKRAVNTYMMMSQIIFGDKELALETAMQVRHIHDKIQGHLQIEKHPFPDDHYEANDANALLWVHATLWETTVLTYEMIYSPLSKEEKDTLYEELIVLGFLFGIPKEIMPKDWDSFIEYNRAMWSSELLSGEDESRQMANYFLDELDATMPKLFSPFFDLMREFTVSTLPKEVREKLALHYRPLSAKAFLWSMKVSARLIWLPVPYNGLFVQRMAKLARLKSSKSLADRYWLFLDTTPMAMLRLTTLIFLSRRQQDDGMSNWQMISEITNRNH